MENNKNIRCAGALFVLVMILYITGDALLTKQATINNTTAAIGGLLMIANSLSAMAIAALLYPMLAAQSKAGALAYLAFRITEGILLMIGMAFLLLPYYAPSDIAIPVETLTSIAKKLNYLMYQTGMLSLGIGGIVCSRLLYKSSLIPKWLSAWGIAGYSLLGIGCMLELSGYPYGILLSVPGGLFELVLGVWLMVKGLRRVPARIMPA